MAGKGERRSYLILRDDYIVVHTVPLTEDEAWLLYWDAYKGVEDRSLKVRYLSEWGNVIDVHDYLGRLEQLDRDLYHRILGFYESPDKFMKKMSWLLRLRKLSPGARQALRELLNRVEEFLREPVEPKPIDAPVRYYEMEYPHVRLSKDGAVQEARPMWYVYACKKPDYDDCYGINVLEDSFWLWERAFTPARVVVVRRDVDDRELVAAVANDGAVQGFLKQYNEDFRELVTEHEDELVDNGYADVVRKFKVMLTTYELLTAGRREEESAST